MSIWCGKRPDFRPTTFTFERMNGKDFLCLGCGPGDGRIAARRIVFPDFFMRRVLNTLIFTGVTVSRSFLLRADFLLRESRMRGSFALS